MKKTVNFALAAALLCGAAATQAGAVDSNSYGARIPEEFSVGRKALPAGDYKVTEIAPGQFAFHHQGLKVAAVVTASVPLGGNTEHKHRLVFRRYAGTLRVAEIWGSSNGAARPRSPEERASDDERSSSVVMVPLKAMNK